MRTAFLKIHNIRTWGLTKRKGLEAEQAQKRKEFDEDIEATFPNMADFGAALYEDRTKVNCVLLPRLHVLTFLNPLSFCAIKFLLVLNSVYTKLDFDVFRSNVQLFVAPVDNPEDETVLNQVCGRLNFFKEAGLTRYDFIHAWVRKLLSVITTSLLIVF